LVGAGANQKLFYIEADALGTPRVLIDPDRNVAVWRWDLASEAFGDSAPNQDPDADGIAFVFDMRFPGQRWDSATGLNYNYYRDYEAGTGRYSQSDPIGLEGGISTYGYANASPLVYADPDGLIPGKIIGFIAQRALPRLGLRWGAGYAVRKAGPRGLRAEIKRRAKARAAQAEEAAQKQITCVDLPTRNSIRERYIDAVEAATKRHNGNVTVQRDGVDLFRVHQPTSGHGTNVTQMVRRPRPADGRIFTSPREVPVRRTHVEQLLRALRGDPRYGLRTRGG
jgi:RHS repeat-associated protein